MSSIAFHAAEQTGYVSGAERAHLNQIVRVAGANLRRSAFGDGDQIRDLRGETLLDVNLNSVIAASDPPTQLAARISGQCEVHMFVEGKDRPWFAGAIEEAVRHGVFRSEEWSRYPQQGGHPNGWQAVADLARADAAGPIVLSYSVCHWFPNPAIAAWPESLPNEDDDWDAALAADQAWCNLSVGERWDRAVAGLRRKAETAWMLRLTAVNLGSPSFGTHVPLTWEKVAQSRAANLDGSTK